MSSPIVLAYSGSFESSAAIPWLVETYGADVIALTLDVGQEQPVEQLRARALACGARRAYLVDARDEFARECVMPCVRRTPAQGRLSIASLARPLVARKLVEIAAAERAAAVAHASRDEAFDGALAALDPNVRVISAPREWTMDASQLAAYARAHRLPHPHPEAPDRVDHLLVRRSVDPAACPDGAARLELTFDNDVPVALNGVDMSPAELLESLSLIGGQYGLGWADPVPTPAAFVLEAAYAALREPAGVVTLRVSRGEPAVLPSERLVSLA